MSYGYLCQIKIKLIIIIQISCWYISLSNIEKLIDSVFLFRAYHSLGLFNPWLNLNNCACQYFSLSHKTLSASSSFYTGTFTINCACKYSNLLVEEQQTLSRLFFTPHLILSVFVSLLGILNVSLKPVADPTYCLPQHLQDIK